MGLGQPAMESKRAGPASFCPPFASLMHTNKLESLTIQSTSKRESHKEKMEDNIALHHRAGEKMEEWLLTGWKFVQGVKKKKKNTTIGLSQ